MDYDTNVAWPNEETTVQAQCALWLDGQKARCEREGPLWDFTHHKFEDQKWISGTDDSISKFLLLSEKSPAQWYGTIYKQSDWFEAGVVDHLPLVSWFRPLPYLFGNDLKQWSAAEKREKVGQLDCIACKNKINKSFEEKRCWFAPTQDLSLIMFGMFRQGRLVTQVDITNKKDDVYGWIPASWKITWHGIDQGKDVVTMRETVAVKEYIINSPLNRNTFDIVFPAGTKVHDQRADTRYIEEANK